MTDVLVGNVWALENPKVGIVETEEMDHRRCVEIQRPYLGPVELHYTGWTPLGFIFPKFCTSPRPRKSMGLLKWFGKIKVPWDFIEPVSIQIGVECTESLVQYRMDIFDPK